MNPETFPESPINKNTAEPSPELLAELARMVNDGTLKQEIDEATGFDSDLEV